MEFANYKAMRMAEFQIFADPSRQVQILQHVQGSDSFKMTMKEKWIFIQVIPKMNIHIAYDEYYNKFWLVDSKLLADISIWSWHWLAVSL